MKKIAILGTGDVGTTLAKGCIDRGYEVMVGSRDGSRAAKVDEVLGVDAACTTMREAAAWGEIVILAVKGAAVEGLAGELSVELANKTVIDVTNPISDTPPEDGVLHFFTSLEESLGERVQKAAPEAKVVKAWNSVGHSFMIQPPFTPRPTMPICGNDEAARSDVALLLEQFGWEVEDFGSMKSARAIEPLCMLWCIPGFLRNEWNHAFKIVKQ